MSSSYEQGTSNRRGGPSRARAARYIAECGRQLGAVLSPLLTRFFEKLEDALYDLADKATNDRDYGVYFDAVRIIREQRRPIQHGFLRLLRQRAEAAIGRNLKSDAPVASDPDLQTGRLISSGDLEEILAVENLVSKAESKYRREILEMTFHLAKVLGRSDLESRCNPYGPNALCAAFRSALQADGAILPPVRLVAYKVFDRHVMDRLGDYYARCVEIAESAGHPRGAGLTRRFRPADAARQAAQTGEASLPEAPPRGGGNPAASQLGSLPDSVNIPFEILQVLLDHLRTPSQVARPLSKGYVEMRTTELLALLNRLGTRVLTEGRTAALTPLTATIGGSLTGASRPLAKSDEDTLDLVFLFFEHLLQGNGVPDGLKALIGRMQIPVAKLALLDKGFFSDPDHPARRLLNHIGEAAVGWGEDDPRTPDSLYGMIERVVERLILDFDRDPAIFVQMDRFFVAFLAHEAAQAREAEALSLSELAAQVPDEDRQAVTKALNGCLARYRQVPTVVDTILGQGWFPAMLTTYRERGVHSDEWRTGIELADRLLWSVQPKVDAEERRQLLGRIPEILRSLRTRLVGSGCDQRDLARWFKDLQTVHLGVLQRESNETAATAAPAVPRARPGRLDLSVGTWIEVTRDDGVKSRLKVAWTSSERANYVLIDRHGRRGLDLTDREIETLLDQGLAKVLGGGSEPIADRALRSVLTRLGN